MNMVEKRALTWLEAHVTQLFLIGCFALGLVMRFAMKDLVTDDYTSYLQPWYEEIKINGISKQVGNYNLVYQTLILMMTKLPINSLYCYKLLSCLFDVILAASAAMITESVVENRGGSCGSLWCCLAFADCLS